MPLQLVKQIKNWKTSNRSMQNSTISFLEAFEEVELQVSNKSTKKIFSNWKPQILDNVFEIKVSKFENEAILNLKHMIFKRTHRKFYYF